MAASLLALLLLGWRAFAQPAFALAFGFLLFSFAWRLLAMLYLGASGPVWAEELGRSVGGDEAGMLFGLAMALTVVVFAMVLRPAALARRLPQRLPAATMIRNLTLGDLVFVALLAFVGLLYADLLRRGVIPLLARMERYDYATRYAGPLHQWLFEYGSLLSAQIGSFFLYPRLRGRSPDWRFLGLFAAILVYCVLTGHRFSAFYAFGSFFVMPLAAVPALRACGRLPVRTDSTHSRLACVLERRSVWLATLLLVVGMVVAALFHSFTTVRAYGEDTGFKLQQRVLVQPVELWWPSWERVFGRGIWQPEAAERWMFEDPIEPGRNTGIQLLMVHALGEARARQLLGYGQQYAGGFPEVLVEWLGPGWWLIAVAVAAWMTALVLRCWLVAFAHGRLLTAFLALYVYYAATLLYIGGMLNFLIAWTFWIKLATFCTVLWLERSLGTVNLSLLPWLLWQRPAVPESVRRQP